MCGDSWENVVSILVSCWGLQAVLHRASAQHSPHGRKERDKHVAAESEVMAARGPQAPAGAGAQAQVPLDGQVLSSLSGL